MSTAVQAPTWGAVLGTWTLKPGAVAAMTTATLAYLLGVRRLHRRGTRWPVSALVSGLGAVAVLLLALDSSMAVYAGALFWVHMLVHLLLIMVAPVLLVWAQPIRLLSEASGPRGHAVVERVVTSAVARMLTSPLFTVPLYTAVIVLTHLTGFQQAMATHMWIHDTELVLYLVTGYLLFLPLIGSEITRQRPSHLLRWVVLALCMGPDTFVGITLMMTDHALAPAYAHARIGWGPTALADQSAAGAIMWFGGDGLMMTMMVVVARQWIRSGHGGLGAWLEGARRRTLLGDTPTGTGTDSDDVDVDDDQAALDAYNATLAALHTRDHRPPTSTSAVRRESR